MKPSDASRTHRAAIRQIVESHRACNARIFGSVVNGSDVEGSDLDLLIDPTPQTTLFDIGAIRHELTNLLGVPVDVLTPLALPEKFRAAVLLQSSTAVSVDTARLAEYLDLIVQAIDRIERYTSILDQAGFLGNELVQDAVIRNLEIIGEASHNIETRFPAFAAAHAELPLVFAYQMRNAIAHGYYKVDLVIVWRTIVNDLPALRTAVLAASRPGPC